LLPPKPETAPKATPARTSGRAGKRRAWITTACAIALLLGVVLTLQCLAGAYHAEFSGYPDEASHFVSGVLVHRYIQAGFPPKPMDFAQRFYLHHPFFAIGHWPPVFYVVEGLWMELFSESRASVMILMALITASLAATTYFLIRREAGAAQALVGAVLLAATPTVQAYGSMVMMDTMLALLSLWAAMSFGRFLGSGRRLHAVAFAGFASLAILTKGNALFLAPVPLLAIALTRRWQILRRGALWAAAAAIVALCLPWHLATLHMILPTFVGRPGIAFTAHAVSFYSGLLLKTLGPVIISLAAIGFVTRLVCPSWRGEVQDHWAVLGAFLISICLFYCLVPAGIEARYSIAVMPVLLLLAVAGANDVAQLCAIPGTRSSQRCWLVLLIAVVNFSTFAFTIPRKASFGFREAATALLAGGTTTDALVLVSTNTAVGEGVFVAEMAMGRPDSGTIILRGSKVLADSNWSHTRYQALYANSEKMRQCIEEAGVGALVLDRHPSDNQWEHHKQLLDMVNRHPDEWRLVGTYSPQGERAADDAGVQLYSYSGARPSPPRDPLAGIGGGGTPLGWPIRIRLSCPVASSQAE